MFDEDPDAAFRAAAFRRLDVLERTHGSPLPWRVIAEGFVVDGSTHLFANKLRGIFRPAGMEWGALSVKTVHPRGSRERRYLDIASGTGLFRYKYQGTDPQARDNVMLRRCYQGRLPLIYLYGIEPGLYVPIRVFIEQMDDRNLECLLSTDARVVAPVVADDYDASPERSYSLRVAKQRVHQGIFRTRVLRAYRTNCAVCGLPHPRLLDAAHIVADSELDGDPKVTNGLALCRIHHGAYDANLMGITPEGIVRVSTELLQTEDGPVLEYGLKGLHGAKIRRPSRIADRPDPQRLAQRYELYLAAAG